MSIKLRGHETICLMGRMSSFFFSIFCIYLFYIEAYLESRRARAPRGDGGVAERQHVCLICKISKKTV